MPIDPRIATSLQPTDMVGSFQHGMDWHDQRQKQNSLKDLLPQAAHGDQAAIDQLWGIDPRIAEHMDDRQREQAAAMTEDLSAAVHWADTPEKWQYVQQHYGAQGVDLSPYRFEDRERGLMTLNKLTGYLKDPPKAEYRTLEPGGSLIDVSNGQPRVVIAPNDGTHQTGDPVSSGDITATGPGGQKLRLNRQSGQWEPVNGGPSQGGSGGFPY